MLGVHMGCLSSLAIRLNMRAREKGLVEVEPKIVMPVIRTLRPTPLFNSIDSQTSCPCIRMQSPNQIGIDKSACET